MQTKPQPGTYEFIQPFSITGCVEYVGVGIAGGMCKKEQTVDFVVGQKIYSNKAFYDDQTDSWSVGVVVFGQNRSIPLSKVARVTETTLKTNVQSVEQKQTTQVPARDELSKPTEYTAVAVGGGVILLLVVLATLWTNKVFAKVEK